MNYETIDTLYRSRITLLEHLESVGYNTKPYIKFSHKEVGEMVKASPNVAAPSPALQMDLERKEGSVGPTNKCVVVCTMGKIKQKLPAFVLKVLDPDETGIISNTTEYIIITLEPIAPNFHAIAFEWWNRLNAEKKPSHVRIRFFQAAAIINNPLKHTLVPLHEKVPQEEEEALLKSLFAKKSQFPLIRFHEDPIARMIGLVPGDIVRITRPSATAGENIGYRVCVP